MNLRKPIDALGVGRTERRDEGLRRVSRLTCWVAAGAAAATGAFTLATARLLPGRAKATTASVSTDTPAVAPADQGDSGVPSPDPGLSPPASAPVPTNLPSRVASGSS